MGNIPTETLILVLKELGAQLPKLQPLDQLIRANAEIARKRDVGSEIGLMGVRFELLDDRRHR